MMRTPLPHMLALSLLCAGCFDSDEDVVDLEDETGETSELLAEQEQSPGFAPSPLANIDFSTGTLWGPCEDEGWGCEGEIGIKLACLRPVSDLKMSVCVPQTWDVAIADDCSNVPDPGFTNGVALAPSKAYCVGSCESDAHCVQGMLCAAAGLCAWHGEP